MIETRTVTVRRCQRCGEDHADLTFTPLDRAADDYMWWALCPTKRQPRVMAEVPPERAEVLEAQLNRGGE